MERMRTFLLYALAIVLLFLLSNFLENKLLRAMYTDIPGEQDGYFEEADGDFSIENMSSIASNTNGYIDFDLVNKTGKTIDKCYLKIDLYNEQGLLADTKYIEILEFQPDERRTFHVKFKANHIKNYKISFVKEAPDDSNMINILGFEVDLSNIFGLGIDISHLNIFGIPLKDLFSWSKLKGVFSGKDLRNRIILLLKDVNWGEVFVVWWVCFFPLPFI